MLSARDLAPGSRFAGGPARPPRRAGYLPAGNDERGQCGAQIRRMRGAQVNLIVGPVKAEADRAFCLTAVYVVDEQSLNLLSHDMLRSLAAN